MEKDNKIVINVDSKKRPINPRIYGNFIEHLGECIHNGIWAYDPVKVPLVEDISLFVGRRGDGVRKDVLTAVRDLKPSVLRAFGGCYSDVYHWKDAIGPKTSRKKVKNMHWGVLEGESIKRIGPEIENQFGTDEFLTFCEEIGALPYLNVNYGSGTPEEAADWVEYCNGSVDSKYGSLRAKYGREEPYNVEIWGIANEIYGFWEVGYEKSPEDYAKKYLKFAKKMRVKDPSIKLVACGWENSKWNQRVLKEIGEDWLDYISIHRYFPYMVGLAKRKEHPDNERCYYALLASRFLVEDFINNTWKDIITVLGPKTHVRISFDEWGLWYTMNDIVRTNYNLQDGIWTALILISFQKMSNVCPMANWAQLINVIGIIQTDTNGLILTPVYLAFRLFLDHMQQNYIDDIKIDCLTYDSEKYGRIPARKEVPYIECCANINDSGDTISIMLINKHISDKMKVELEIRGFMPKKRGKMIYLSSKSPFHYNTIENREKIKIVEKDLENCNSNINMELDPHSITVLQLTKK